MIAKAEPGCTCCNPFAAPSSFTVTFACEEYIAYNEVEQLAEAIARVVMKGVAEFEARGGR